MRLAWFSPWPPQQSGVAGRSAEVTAALVERGYGIDVFVDAAAVPVTATRSDSAPSAGERRVQSAHDFVWRRARHQYDLVVYQVGNSRLHEFIWPYLFRWPGLAVLHDARLHHARGRSRLLRRRFDEYREELAWSHPDTSPDAAELGISGFDGTYYYLWPMTRAVVRASRLVATHARGAVAALLDDVDSTVAVDKGPGIEYIALGEGSETPPTPDDRATTRAFLGFAASHVVFGLFGGLSNEKRVEGILEAASAVAPRLPAFRLLLAGTSEPGAEVQAAITSRGLDRVAQFLPSPDDEQFDRLIAAVDVSLNLRWPTALETSGPWLRALAAERPTVTIALAHQAHIPALDPRTWAPWPGNVGDPPVTAAIDILDEAHSLRLALDRLTTDAALRASLGHAGRSYWAREHRVARMVDDYERVVRRTAARPDPVSSLPIAVRPDPVAYTETLVTPFGVSCGLR